MRYYHHHRVIALERLHHRRLMVESMVESVKMTPMDSHRRAAEIDIMNVLSMQVAAHIDQMILKALKAA